MIGLFGLLNVGASSLSTQQQGIEVTGHNLANVNNPDYARQRLNVGTAISVPSDVGPQGTGVQALAIVQIRSSILDSQIQDEASVSGSLEAQQSALQLAQSDLGEQLDSLNSGAQAGAAAQGVGSSHSLADGLSNLFSSFQSLSNDPSSMAERENTLSSATLLANQFNQVDQRLTDLNASLNTSVQTDTDSANGLLTQIASLNDQISRVEITSGGTANDLRDTRQARLEDLSKLVKIDVSKGANGTLNVSAAGTLLVSGNQVSDTLQTYDSGGGQLLVRATNSGTPLNLTGGSIQGTIDARDGTLAKLRNGVNSLASLLITEVNGVHSSGYSLTGSTNAPFFSGTDASDIQVNSALTADPSLIQAASVSGTPGDNGVALALAQLGQKQHAGQANQTYGQIYSQTSTDFGQSLASVNSQYSNQQLVTNMLTQQRNSVSGVSLDEEMTNLTLYQRAFQASAKIITTVDTLLDTVVNMKA